MKEKWIEQLDVFHNRMKNVGVDLMLAANYPYIYIDTINGKKVTEKFYGNCGFVLALTPIKPTGDLNFVGIVETFKLIRKYKGD